MAFLICFALIYVPIQIICSQSLLKIESEVTKREVPNKRNLGNINFHRSAFIWVEIWERIFTVNQFMGIEDPKKLVFYQDSQSLYYPVYYFANDLHSIGGHVDNSRNV